MRVTVVVLYRRALAHYTVSISNDATYEARLSKYCGSSHDLPPPKLLFKKEGRHCLGNTEDKDLMDDLYYAVKLKLHQDDPAAVISNTNNPEKAI